MAPGLDNQSINSWQPILSSLPFEIFLILGTHLGTRSLSRLSRTCRTLRILLAFQLKRHHIFRLVGSYLLRTCRPYRRSIPRLGSIFRLSRTCRTLQNALAPFAHELHLGYAPMYIHKCTNLNDLLGVVRCLTSIGTPYPDLSYCAEVPLRFAVLKRREKIVEVLLDHGLSPHGRNCDLRTPLMVAIENQDEGIVKMLLEKGARVGNVWRVQHHHWVGYSMRRLLEEYGIEMKWEVRRGTKSLWV